MQINQDRNYSQCIGEESDVTQLSKRWSLRDSFTLLFCFHSNSRDGKQNLNSDHTWFLVGNLIFSG